MSGAESRIQVYHSGANFFVWDPEDAFKIRSEYRLAGRLVGAQVSQVKKSGPDNVVKGLVGLPMLLSRYEVAVGLGEGFLQIIEEDVEKWKVSSDENAALDNQRIVDLESSALVARRQGFAKKYSNMNKIVSDAEIDAEARASLAEKPATFSLNGIILPRPGASVVVETQTIHPSTSNQNDSSLFDASTLFLSDQDSLKARVFHDLWKQGFYITEGSKFGGDFLIYPDDPLKYHASFIVRVCTKESLVTALELGAASRLGVRVKKPLVLATSLSDGSFDYMNIEWLGTT